MAKQTSTLPQYQYKRKHGFFYNLKKYRVLTLMCVPAIVFFFAFNYMPLPGIYVAFVKYNYRDGIFGSKFVGMKNFEFLMQSGKLLGLTKNTILYNLAFIFLGNIIAMLMAVLLNEIHNKYFTDIDVPSILHLTGSCWFPCIQPVKLRYRIYQWYFSKAGYGKMAAVFR